MRASESHSAASNATEALDELGNEYRGLYKSAYPLPGPALAYMTGRLEIVRLRQLARSRLVERFDITAFHDTVLSDGSIPLSLLADNVERWVTGGLPHG